MEIKRVFERDEQLISSLVTVWESSIRATHDFFSETNIREIKKYVFQAIEEFQNFELLLIIKKHWLLWGLLRIN